ncbi:Amyloid-beta A4 precursor protein-binding family B member 2 [Takifugu flavidus]|uniref:Amyloid-beta A4 protein-binding family B member 2 n=1 Tax=Takifugu flavidus TaxID=433684 RepID=A0A5C6MQ51_9TELE|nr:Amyloid-beta A4 precursor protein-binding family B member 2 [Takifugu flavidus]
MMSVETPPLSRSGSSPSNVGLSNRGGASAAPPTSLSLRSSYNQLLGRDVIKESMETGSSATLPKSRQRHTMTSVRSAMGISENLSYRNQSGTRGRGLPTKSSSSSALYSSTCSSSLFNTTNPKLAKNGANMQRRAESQQLELSRATTESKIHNDRINNSASDWLESEKDNSQLPPFRRRTKSFLEYHEKALDLDLRWGYKEDRKEKNQETPPEKEQASPTKEREAEKEEKQSLKQTPQEEEELEPVTTEEEEDNLTRRSRQPLLPVVMEAPLSSPSSSSTNSPEWLPDNQNQAPVQVREDLCANIQPSPRSPAKPPRSSQPRVIKVELHPNNENQFLQQYPSSPKQARAADRSRPPASLPEPGKDPGLPEMSVTMDMTPVSPSEDEDSSWTTLSQETPSPQTPQETDVWGDGDLPPGWREISDSSEVYFWHVPTGTTQYHRPVAPGNQHASPNGEAGAEDDLRDKLEERVQPSSEISSPRQRPSSLISDSSVEPVPSPSESYLSSSPASTTLFNDVPPSGPNLNISAAKELKDYPVYPDPSLKAFEGATLRYASLKLKYSATQSFILLSPPTKCLILVKLSIAARDDVAQTRCNFPLVGCFRSPPAQLETVDLDNTYCDAEAMGDHFIVHFSDDDDGDYDNEDDNLRSSVAVHHCIRQLSYCRRDIRDSAGVWGEGKGMLLVLQDRMLNLIDPDDHSLLHSQPISSIRVWGVGRDHDRSVGARHKNDCESFVATGSEHSCVMIAEMRCKHDPGCRNT